MSLRFGISQRQVSDRVRAVHTGDRPAQVGATGANAGAAMNATGTRTGNRASHITSTLPLKRAIPAKTGMPTKRPQSNLGKRSVVVLVPPLPRSKRATTRIPKIMTETTSNSAPMTLPANGNSENSNGSANGSAKGSTNRKSPSKAAQVRHVLEFEKPLARLEQQIKEL